MADTKFADYIVYADESGDHSLTSIDKEFPVFCLSFCLFEKTKYAAEVIPDLTNFKFKYWGVDQVILHERDVRKALGDFAFLQAGESRRKNFLSDLSDLVAQAPFSIIAAVIDKKKLLASYSKPWNPYDIALHFCMERLLDCLIASGQSGSTVHVVFECRGKAEDQALELEFRRIVSGERWLGYSKKDYSKIRFEPIFAPKSRNSAGLQIADLTARPIATKAIRRDQSSRAYDVLKSKLIDTKIFP